MKIDLGKMLCAVSTCLDEARAEVGAPEDTAFLHRTTGKIVFLHENEGDTEAWQGTDVAIDSVFDRASIDNSPDEWIEIPKCHTEGNEEEFIRVFLAGQGIDAELE